MYFITYIIIFYQKMNNIFKKVFKDKALFLNSLEHFSITPNKGFMAFYTEDVPLSSTFEKYNQIYEHTFEVLNSGNVNEEIKKLFYEEDELNKISSITELTKIFSIMTVLTNSYLYFNRNNPSIRLPRQLAVPLYHSSNKLKILPVFCLWSSIHGIKQLNKTNTYEIENLKMRFSFTCRS